MSNATITQATETPKEKPKPQMHVSFINMMAKCGEQARRRYILGEKIPPGVAAIVGTAVDRAVGKNLTSKARRNGPLPVEEVMEAARDTLTGEWQKGVTLDAEQVAAGVRQVRDAAIDKAVRLSRLHTLEVAPQIEPSHVARKFVIELPGFPMDLAGEIDVQESTRRVRDTKTTAKTPAGNVAETSDQLTMYSMAGRVLDGKPPESVALDYLVDLKTPKAVTYESTRTEEDFKPLLRRVEHAAVAIERGVFFPAPADSWVCSKKFCGYYSTCPYVRRPVSISVPGSDSE